MRCLPLTGSRRPRPCLGAGVTACSASCVRPGVSGIGTSCAARWSLGTTTQRVLDSDQAVVGHGSRQGRPRSCFPARAQPEVTISMRPRRIRRGIAADRFDKPGPELVASMRPRRIRRGIPSPASPPGRPRNCFNEAPANSPGNYPSHPTNRAHAAIASMRPRRIRRGIPRHPHPRGHGPQRASMRPRRIRSRTPFSPTGNPCFNEAPANSPGNSLSHAILAYRKSVLQ